jgi:hypothetical protein
VFQQIAKGAADSGRFASPLARDEYERFRHRLGVQRKANAGSDS